MGGPCPLHIGIYCDFSLRNDSIHAWNLPIFQSEDTQLRFSLKACNTFSLLETNLMKAAYGAMK
jgi:hypothetical protein